MIDAFVRQARKKGVKEHRLIHFVRREVGTHINVLRFDSEANPQCSVPCVLCRTQLIKFGISVRCITPSGECFSGALDDETAPKSKLTSGQRRRMPPQ